MKRGRLEVACLRPELPLLRPTPVGIVESSEMPKTAPVTGLLALQTPFCAALESSGAWRWP